MSSDDNEDSGTGQLTKALIWTLCLSALGGRHRDPQRRRPRRRRPVESSGRRSRCVLRPHRRRRPEPDRAPTEHRLGRLRRNRDRGLSFLVVFLAIWVDQDTSEEALAIPIATVAPGHASILLAGRREARRTPSAACACGRRLVEPSRREGRYILATIPIRLVRHSGAASSSVGVEADPEPTRNPALAAPEKAGLEMVEEPIDLGAAHPEGSSMYFRC